jgi:hypothetical protein
MREVVAMPMKLGIGDTVRLKKQHPCGGFEWQITRIGADIGLRCLTCGRKVLLARSKIEKRIKVVVPASDETSTKWDGKA